VGVDGKPACPVKNQGAVSKADFAGGESILMIDAMGVSYGVTQFDAASVMTNAGVNGSPAGALAAISTVDLAKEFTDLINTPRVNSAATRIITTADDTMQELMQIKH
jgi:Flagellar basal body rod FlgEFG protein C-terminal